MLESKKLRIGVEQSIYYTHVLFERVCVRNNVERKKGFTESSVTRLQCGAHCMEIVRPLQPVERHRPTPFPILSLSESLAISDSQGTLSEAEHCLHYIVACC